VRRSRSRRERVLCTIIDKRNNLTPGLLDVIHQTRETQEPLTSNPQTRLLQKFPREAGAIRKDHFQRLIPMCPPRQKDNAQERVYPTAGAIELAEV
jgi:hypothetical protein